MDKKRIVITGIGVISPIGIGKDQFWESLKQGKSGFKAITLFDTADLRVKVAGEITNFNAKEILENQNLMDLDRATLLLLSATKLALDDAQLEITNESSQQLGVSVGTTFGSLHSISEFDKESLREGPRYVNPSIFPSTVGNSPASHLSIRFLIKGFNSTISTGMCACLDALDYARDLIHLGRINRVVVGAVEDLSIQIFLGLYKLNCLSGLNSNLKPLSCPFDKRRDGIICSEGSTVFILEEFNSAIERKANIYAEILGIGSSFDPAKFYTYNPKSTGMVEAMHLALKDANLRPQDIDCIFANANSTPDADLIETKAIKEVFGNYAYKIPVTAIKSMLGETFGASGGLSTAAAIGAFNTDFISPIINYQEKDPDCNLDYVVNKGREKRLDKALINCFSSSGANTTLIIGKFTAD